MKFLVVVIVSVVCAGAAAAAVASSCAHAEEFFLRHNASADDGRETGPICGGQCCGRGREAQLRAALRKNAEHRFKTTITPLMELLLSTRRTLQEHLIELSRESQNKTAGLFLQVYREHAVRARAPLTNLYDDIRTLLRMESNTEELGSRPPKDLADSSRKFFREIFPVTYQSVLKLEAKQFTPEYEECLKAAYDAVLPFGDIPKQMGSSLSRSLEAARVILEVLAAGASALNASERVLVSTDEECYDKILRVHGCSYCRGYDVKPCKIYCLNVARGCIGSLVAELDAPWDSYTEGLELLTKPDADVALRDLETQVSKAIMYAYALENHAILESKVRQECGTPATFDLPSQPSTPHPPAARRNSLRAPPPYTELLHFAASLARNKRLFAKMTDQLCEAENEDDAQCWNGDSVGKYTKVLVASASVSDQKYNPEVTVANRDHDHAAVAALRNRFLQARQLLMTSALKSAAPAAEAFMQGDEAGEEGSGSGKNYDSDEGNDDTFYDQGSGDTGSGMEGSRSFPGGEPTFTSTVPGTSYATTSRPVLTAILSVALMSAARYCLT